MATLTHIRLLVDDFRACVRWYNEMLGFEITFDDGDNYADLKLNDTTALGIAPRALMADVTGGEKATGDHAVLIVGVADVDAELERLRAAGVTIAAEPVDRPDWGLRTAHVRDPDGNLVELYRSLGAP